MRPFLINSPSSASSSIISHQGRCSLRFISGPPPTIGPMLRNYCSGSSGKLFGSDAHFPGFVVFLSTISSL